MDATGFSHLDDDGQARMVDVGDKEPTRRAAMAEARIRIGAEIAARLAASGGTGKGDVLGTARLAGIMAAKRTAELIPMCHPLQLDHVEVSAHLTAEAVVLTGVVRSTGRTGVEMEAMTAVAIAALTVYDMCKSAGKGIVIEEIRLLEKTGGASGIWRADDQREQP